MSGELIRDKGDLISYLTTKKIASKNNPEFVYVSSKLRKDILTDEMQGYFIHRGRRAKFGFESAGGGVYKAFIDG